MKKWLLCPYANIPLGHEEDLITFWWNFPNFQGHSRAKEVIFKPNRACLQEICCVFWGGGICFL